MSLRGGDRYYRLAKGLGAPSRAYFKLAHLNKKHSFLARGSRVVDLGSSPGGWVSYELSVVGETGRVVAVDVDELKITPSPNLVFIQKDIFEVEPNNLITALGGMANVFVSDLAPRFTGIRSVDMARHYELISRALELSTQTLRENGWFIVKLFMSAEIHEFIRDLRTRFASVKIEKPQSSRSSSSEVYAVCRQIKGNIAPPSHI
ncbi:MAG: RlmE family RNA methyltransferase [Thermoprotei archaeon]